MTETAVSETAAPTLEDARTAGRALTDAGAREVLAYGSVVAGGADPVSDIDLVATRAGALTCAFVGGGGRN